MKKPIVDIQMSVDKKSAVLKLAPVQKAVLSAVLQLGKSGGQVDPSIGLGKAINGSLKVMSDQERDADLIRITTFVETMDSTENLRALFSSKVPPKLRDVKLNDRSLAYIDKVFRSFNRDWVIVGKGGKVLKRFSLTDSIVSKVNETVGTTLLQLITSRFKNVSQNNSLDVKARGTHLVPGDFIHLYFYLLKLDMETSGTVEVLDLTLNFVTNTYSGTTETFDLESEKIEEMDETEEMSEDLDEDEDRDDYDPLER